MTGTNTTTRSTLRTQNYEGIPFQTIKKQLGWLGAGQPRSVLVWQVKGKKTGKGLRFFLQNAFSHFMTSNLTSETTRYSRFMTQAATLCGGTPCVSPGRTPLARALVDSTWLTCVQAGPLPSRGSLPFGLPDQTPETGFTESPQIKS